MRNDGTVLIPRLAITSTSAPTATTWSTELTQALTPYLVSAQEQLAQGRAEEAVALWQAALHDVPGLPVPRRQTITGLIRTTAYDCARAVC